MSEYWIQPGGSLEYADGDVSDYNHEGVVISALARQWAEFVGDGSLQCQDEFDPNDLGDLDEIYPKVVESGVPEEEAMAQLKVLAGSSDAREYACRYWRWITCRIHGSTCYMEAWTLDADTIKSMVDGVEAIWWEDRGEEEPPIDLDLVISTYHGDRHNITYGDLASGNLSNRSDPDIKQAAINARAALTKLDQEMMPSYYKGKLGDSVSIDRFLSMVDGIPTPSLLHEADSDADLIARGHGIRIGSCGHVVGRCRCSGHAGRLKVYLDHPCTECAEEVKVTETLHEAGCAMLSITNKSLKDRIIAFGREIPNNELAGDGRETYVHVTALYGFDQETPATARMAAKIIHQTTKGKPIEATMGKVNHFECDEYDVVKIPLESEMLTNINKALRSFFPHTNSYRDYKPHITIAYVKKGEAKKYDGDSRFAGKKVKFAEFKFSYYPGGGDRRITRKFPIKESSSPYTHENWQQAVSDYEEDVIATGGYQNEYLFILDDNDRVHMRRGTSHEIAFGHKNRYRKFGWTYSQKFNIITVDEVATRSTLDLIVGEVKWRLKVDPVALWNGWFTDGRWIPCKGLGD